MMKPATDKVGGASSSPVPKREQDAPATIEPRLTPKLRFPEYREEPGWTTETLGAVATLSTEKVGDNNCTPMSVTAGVGLLSQQEKFGRLIAGSSYKNYLLLKKNDFAYNKSATKDYPQGFIALYSGEELAAVPNSIFTCFRIKGASPAPEYLNYLFLRNLHGQWLRKYIEVSARAHGSLSIADEDLLALPIPIPSGELSLAEQRKVASCLSSLDDLIVAENRKLDALKAHKKGLMQQLFPREGETRPRLRFPEFKDANTWRKQTLSDVLRKASTSVEVEPKTMYREIGVRSHGNGVFHKAPVSGEGIGKKRVFQVVENALVLNIVFAWEQAVATTSQLETGMIASHRFPMYVPQSEACDVRFMKMAFLTPHGKHLLGMASPGGAGRNRTLGQAEFERLGLLLPDKGEQTKIANSVIAIENLIAVQSDKIEALKTHKNGLMQQLFPSSEHNEMDV